MPVLRSRKGCVPCKVRRKKCSEQRPSCDACLRLNLECFYQSCPPLPSQRHRSKTLATFELQLPPNESRILSVTSFDSEIEQRIISRIPTFAKNFHTTLSSENSRDPSTLMQLTMNEQHVRKSIVACCASYFSRVHDECKSYYQATHGKAMEAVRLKMSEKRLGKHALFSLIVAVLYLGLIETNNPELSISYTTHWKGAAALIGKYQNDFNGAWLDLPRALCIVILEGIFYYSTQAIFAPHDPSIQQFWEYSSLYNTLVQLNPQRNLRAQASPVLAGQYEIHQAAFEITMFLRSNPQGPTFILRLSNMEMQIISILSQLPDNFSFGLVDNSAECARLLSIYELFCQSLLLCIFALQLPSEHVSQRLRDLVELELESFLQLPPSKGANTPMMWPLQILACAIDDDEKFERFEQGFANWKPCLDPGHVVRAEAVLQRIRTIRAKPMTEQEIALRKACGASYMPRCMILLRQPGGILGCDF